MSRAAATEARLRWQAEGGRKELLRRVRATTLVDQSNQADGADDRDEKKANGDGERPPARGHIPNDVQDGDVDKDDDRGQHDDGKQKPFLPTPLLRHHHMLP